MFAAVIALRLAAHASQRTGILLFLIGPIVVVSLAYRPLEGAGMATASLLAYLVSQLVDGGALDAVGAGTRAFTYYAIPLTIWLARTDARPEAPADRGDLERPSPSPRSAALTRREREVLGLVAAGHTNAEIARILVLSVRTVESHRASLRRKLGRPSRPELVRHAQRWGLLPADNALATSDGVAPADRHAPGLVY